MSTNEPNEQPKRLGGAQPERPAEGNMDRTVPSLAKSPPGAAAKPPAGAPAPAVSTPAVAEH